MGEAFDQIKEDRARRLAAEAARKAQELLAEPAAPRTESPTITAINARLTAEALEAQDPNQGPLPELPPGTEVLQEGGVSAARTFTEMVAHANSPVEQLQLGSMLEDSVASGDNGRPATTPGAVSEPRIIRQDTPEGVAELQEYLAKLTEKKPADGAANNGAEKSPTTPDASKAEGNKSEEKEKTPPDREKMKKAGVALQAFRKIASLTNAQIKDRNALSDERLRAVNKLDEKNPSKGELAISLGTGLKTGDIERMEMGQQRITPRQVKVLLATYKTENPTAAFTEAAKALTEAVTQAAPEWDRQDAMPHVAQVAAHHRSRRRRH
jgi:hypothetical protein